MSLRREVIEDVVARMIAYGALIGIFVLAIMFLNKSYSNFYDYYFVNPLYFWPRLVTGIITGMAGIAYLIASLYYLTKLGFFIDMLKIYKRICKCMSLKLLFL